ncbi:uncharacterized protein LOC135477892 isoform X2 [Liolophura sinensis]|uniref:uncharacterized protein LOC135477892 isoform X2 n=1 Tax=Liolophura sinensis TaxID=3198878 RepID=UPI00315860B6
MYYHRKLSCLNRPSSQSARSSLPDLTGWHWLGLNPSNDEDTDTNSGIIRSRDRMPRWFMRHARMCVTVTCCLLYLLAMCLSVNCNETSSQSFPENASLKATKSCTMKMWIQILRSLKFPLISILGVISISFVTRLVFFLCALYTWRCQFQRSAAASFGPFTKPAKLLQMFIIVCLVIAIYTLCSLAFNEDLTFVWAEVFAPAGLATIITVSLGIEGDTEFEKNFQHKNEKDGYVYGLAHAYFQDMLEPFLTPWGQRQTLLRWWSDYGPSETFLVLLVECTHFAEEVFMNEELAQDVEIVDTKNGVFLLRISLGRKNDRFFYVHVPVLINEHLLSVHDWFRSDGRTRLPLDEQKAEYEATLYKLLRDKRQAVDGALGRVLFWRIPNVSVQRIPDILRRGLYRAFGTPNSESFLENITQVWAQNTNDKATGSPEMVRRRISNSDRSSSNRDSAMSGSSGWSTCSTGTC